MQLVYFLDWSTSLEPFLPLSERHAGWLPSRRNARLAVTSISWGLLAIVAMATGPPGSGGVIRWRVTPDSGMEVTC